MSQKEKVPISVLEYASSQQHVLCYWKNEIIIKAVSATFSFLKVCRGRIVLFGHIKNPYMSRPHRDGGRKINLMVVTSCQPTSENRIIDLKISAGGTA